jgi:cytochrome c oxidase subunit IV
MTATAQERDGARRDDHRFRGLAPGFAALIAMTVAELTVVDLQIGRAARVTVLCGLLLAKAGLVSTVFLRVRLRRRDPRLALAAVLLAAGFAVVLMLETAFRMRQR